MVPLLLSKGITNDAAEVRKISLTTIMKIVKVGGSLLEAHLTEIVGILLEGLSSMEPAQLNYLQFHGTCCRETKDECGGCSG